MTAAARAALSVASIAAGREAETLLNGLGGGVGARLLTRGDGDFGAFDVQHRGGAHADRAGAGEHDGLLALEIACLGEQRDAGGGCRIGAVGVEHRGDAEIREEALLHRLEHGLARDHGAAADEDRRELLLLRAARVDAAVDERADVLRASRRHSR